MFFSWVGWEYPLSLVAVRYFCYTELFKTMQMVDVHVPTTDGRELVLSRYTQPEAEHRMLLEQLGLKLPQQPPPKITAKQVRQLEAPVLL